MEVRVRCVPTHVLCTCEKCEHEEEMSYDDFTCEYGDPPDWDYNVWKCPECGHENEIDSQDWD